MKKLMVLLLMVTVSLMGCSESSAPQPKQETIKEDGEVNKQEPSVEIEEVNEDEKVTALIQPLQGYLQEENGLTVCELTEETLMCGVLTVDSYAYAPIDSVEPLEEDQVKLVLKDGTDIILYNITENSFDMFGLTFLKTTGEAILAQNEYMQPLDEYFSKENIFEVYQNGQGQHDLLKDWRE